jgi:hypothetical protein
MERKEIQLMLSKALIGAIEASGIADTPDHRRRIVRATMRIAIRIVLASKGAPSVAAAIFMDAMRDECALAALPEPGPVLWKQPAN